MVETLDTGETGEIEQNDETGKNGETGVTQGGRERLKDRDKTRVASATISVQILAFFSAELGDLGHS